MKQFLLLLVSIVTLQSYGYSPKDLRFHCANDTIKISELLSQGKAVDKKDPRELTIFYGEKLIDTPYVGHTLEGDKEYLTINVDELDCTTFVETLIALSQTTLSGSTSWRDYARNLEKIRYRKGEINGYASRLHYISDWLMDNTNRGNLLDITSKLPECKYEIKSLDFMTQNRDSYPALKDDEQYEKIKNVEMGYRSHRIPIIKKTSLNYKAVANSLKDGDIIALTTKIEGLDVSHMGIIKFVNNKPYLLHASSIGGKVMIDKNDLAEMLRRSKTNTGIRVISIVD